MVRHPGKPDSTEIDRVEITQRVQRVIRHHGAKLVVTLTTPIEVFVVELDPEATGSGIEYTQPLRHDLFANAVACDDCDAVCHVEFLCQGASITRKLSMRRALPNCAATNTTQSSADSPSCGDSRSAVLRTVK